MTEEPKKLETIALIVAGGRSERMQGGIPKQYRDLSGQSVLRRVVKTFLEHPEIDGVRVVIRREHHALYKQATANLTLLPCTVGGDTRQDSVRIGLESIAHFEPKYVLVHDAARPMASKRLISRILKELKTKPAVIPVLPTVNTIKKVEDGKVTETLERGKLVSVQTPQGFDYKTLCEAHERAKGKELTDDAAVCENAGIDVFTVEGETGNYKITTSLDIKLMKTQLELYLETRTGMGFDVHKLAAHDKDIPVTQQYIKICGIRIPFTHYMVGHSDADVGIHALVDAILGAIGDGDIGTHFPPDNPKWKGADSERFLLYAYGLLKDCGGELVNMDITIIGERPKISKYREKMIEHLAQIIKINPKRISIKATTTEKLGFTGRSEGLAAQAVVTIRLPRIDDL